MSTRFHIQIAGEEQPRGPMSAFTLRGMLDRGEVTGDTPALLVGEEEWQTVDWHWPQIEAETPRPRAVPSPPPSAAAVAAVAAAAALPDRSPQLPVWRVVYGVCFLVASFGTFGWALLALLSLVKSPVQDTALFMIVCLLVGIVQFFIGMAFTTRSK